MPGQTFGPGWCYQPRPKGLWSRFVAGTGTKGPFRGDLGGSLFFSPHSLLPDAALSPAARLPDPPAVLRVAPPCSAAVLRRRAARGPARPLPPLRLSHARAAASPPPPCCSGVAPPSLCHRRGLSRARSRRLASAAVLLRRAAPHRPPAALSSTSGRTKVSNFFLLSSLVSFLCCFLVLEM